MLLAGAYLLGSIPFGLLLASRVRGIDVRTAGSGNIGATNVARSAGKVLGVFTLLLDGLKGAAPVLLGQHWLHLPLCVVAMAGVTSVVGHVFPVWLRFRGGKGVATGLGVFLALTPVPSLIALGVFVLTYAVARVVSVGSLLASVALLAAIALLDGRRPVLIASGVVVAVVVLRHKSNILRILQRTEHGV